MKKLLITTLFLFSIVIVSAQNPPVAINDTVITMSELPIAVSVLLNDYDPDDDAIEIRNVRSPEHGERDNDDEIIYYTPDLYIGWDSLEYRIREVENTSSLSEYAWVFFIVNENPNLPIAVDDELSVLQLEPTVLNILENDSDPNGDAFVIYEVHRIEGPFAISLAEDSLSVTVTTNYPLEYDVASFRYRIKEKNTENAYYSEWATVTVEILDNQDIPIATDDNASTTGGETIDIYVLENDINPSSSTLVIETAGGSTLGSVEIVNDHIRYSPNFSEYGKDTLSYKIQLEEQPYLYDYGEVIVTVASNPGRPVAVDDIGTGVCGGETTVEVISNDYDPDGDAIEIKDVNVIYPNSFVEAQIQGELINIITVYQEIVINSEIIRLEYRVQEVDNPNSYSEWATVVINMEQNPDFPMLIKDYENTIAGYPNEIDLLANDNLNGFSPIVYVFHGGDGYGYMDNNKYNFTSNMTYEGKLAMFYTLQGAADGYFSFGEIEVDVVSNHSHDTLDINNIQAGINSDGYLFAKLEEVIDFGSSEYHPLFQYPKGSGKNTIFCYSLWIGGVDKDESLHLAAQRYKQVGYDFQLGPISNSYDGIEFFTKWSSVWKVSKDEVNYHRNNYWKSTYNPVIDIINWPGNGDVTNGQAEQLAPYFDNNNNGVYEPMQGDYPLIRGDQTVLFIYNDDRFHTETDGESMKVEIHGMAYGYDEPGDEMLNNTVFVHYDIYNRSDNTYYDTYLGAWTDIDLGYARDDYIGSHVELGSYYVYNGTPVDGSGEPFAYGFNPPTQGVTIVAGPYMDEDGFDNPDGGCDYSLNGLNFGDGIVDNERLGMISFIYHNNSGGSHGDPQFAPDYYNYLKGLWKDNTPLLYGGNGHESSPGTVGPECRFMFPGASDPCNWGTDGVLPNDGYNQDGKYWTEETADNGAPNPPEDRRGLGATGPFTFKPGDRQELELAFSVGQGEDGPYSSTQQLFENLENLFELVDNGEVIIPSDQLAVDEHDGNSINLKIYPNPIRDVVYIEAEGETGEVLNYQIYNSHGIVVKQGQLTTNVRNTIDILRLEQGFYIIRVKQKDTAISGRFIKM